jgi:hypothetical protein
VMPVVLSGQGLMECATLKDWFRNNGKQRFDGLVRKAHQRSETRKDDPESIRRQAQQLTEAGDNGSSPRSFPHSSDGPGDWAQAPPGANPQALSGAPSKATTASTATTATTVRDGTSTSAIYTGPWLVTTRASDAKPRPVSFLDGGHLPLGKLVVVAGQGARECCGRTSWRTFRGAGRRLG